MLINRFNAQEPEEEHNEEIPKQCEAEQADELKSGRNIILGWYWHGAIVASKWCESKPTDSNGSPLGRMPGKSVACHVLCE